MLEVLEGEPELCHLAQHVATCLAGRHGLEAHGKLWGRGEEGESQGDPEASPLFCVAWHPFVRELDAVLSAAGGKSLFGNYDGYLIGPAAVVFPALETFAAKIRNRSSSCRPKPSLDNGRSNGANGGHPRPTTHENS